MGLLDGKAAIVTGSGTGIGRQYALALAREGASREPAQKVADEIKAAGGIAVPDFNTVNTVEGGQNIFKTAVDSFGKVDILINNAGIRRDKSFAKMTEDMWDEVVLTNLKGTFCVTRPVFEHMKQRGGPGRIINVSSVAGLYGNFGQANYAAAKAGVAGFTFALAIEGRKYGITANCLLPYAVTRLTETLPAFQGEEASKNLDPALVPPTAIWLCTNEAADVTGKMFFIRGNSIDLIYVDRSAVADKPLDEGSWNILDLGKKAREFLREFTLKKVLELPFPSRAKK